MTTPFSLKVYNTKTVQGVPVKEFADVEGTFLANFKTYGGTERESNGVYFVEDTANVVCWYRPDIKRVVGLKGLQMMKFLKLWANRKTLNKETWF